MKRIKKLELKKETIVNLPKADDTGKCAASGTCDIKK